MKRLTLEDALYVCANMRERDQQCIQALLGEVSYDIFAVNRWQTGGPAWCLEQDGIPTVIFGLSFHNDWLAVAWMVATPGCSRQSFKKLMRFARTVRANVMAPGPHQKRRIEAHVLSGWDEASRFAEHLGFVHEGIRRKAGKDGQDLEMWAVT